MTQIKINVPEPFKQKLERVKGKEGFRTLVDLVSFATRKYVEEIENGKQTEV